MGFEFYLVTGLLLALAALFVVFPLLQHHGEVASRQATNVDVFRERERELDAERVNGQIDQQQYDRLVHELQRRLLEDEASSAVEAEARNRPAGFFTVAVILVLVAFAALLYQQNGFRQDWVIKQALDQAREKVAAGENADDERRALLTLLDQRLQQRQDEPFYLMLKGNVEMELQRYQAAEASFARLLEVLPNDPTVMSSLLEVRYRNAGRKLGASDLAMAQRVLEIDPRNIRTLGLLGINSFEERRFADAIRYWQQLLPLVGPFSPNGKMISQGIVRAESLMAEQGESPATEPAAIQEQAEQGPSLLVEVTLGAGVEVAADASVFVYARPANGSRMPLAVQRLQVTDLPAQVRLNDSMAMAPGMNLSSVDEVEVVARISKRGMANRGSGDIEGIYGPLSTAEGEQIVRLVIDSVVP